MTRSLAAKLGNYGSSPTDLTLQIDNVQIDNAFYSNISLYNKIYTG